MQSQGRRSARRTLRERPTGPVQLLLLGANHRTCPLDQRETLLRRATHARLQRGASARAPWDDLVLLTTCNRIEVYAATRTPETAVQAIAAALDILPDDERFYVLRGEAAAAHLFRVASGLDSLAQGEAQVMAQVRQAPSLRPHARRQASALAVAFERAARTAPRIRTLAGLDATGASASHAALRFLGTSVPLARPTIGLLGTGKMARIAAASLRGTAKILVVNRDPKTAREVARDLGGRGSGLDGLDAMLEASDVVLAATRSAKPLVTARRLERVLPSRKGRPLWLVDLGFPRNVDAACGELPGVTLVDIDGLAPWGAQPPAPAALARAEDRIREEAGRVASSLEPSASEDIAALRRSLEAIRRSEVAEAFERLPALSDGDRAVVDKLATRLVNRLYHGPTEHLRSLRGEERAERVRELLRGLGGEDS